MQCVFQSKVIHKFSKHAFPWFIISEFYCWDKKCGKLMFCWCFLLMNYKWIHIIHLPWPFQKTRVSCPSPVRSAVVWWWMCDRANRRGWVRSGVCQNSWALPGSWLESGQRKKTQKASSSGKNRNPIHHILHVDHPNYTCVIVFFFPMTNWGQNCLQWNIAFFCWGYSFMVIWGNYPQPPNNINEIP